MKITFVTEYFGVKGGFRVIALYANLLARRGHEVLIVSQPPRRLSFRQRARRFFASGQLGGAPAPSPYLSGLEAMHRVVKSRRPVTDADIPDADVIIATWWETAFWVSALSESKGKKFYFVQHHEIHSHLPWQISRGSYFLPMRKIAISKWLVDVMAGNYNDHEVHLVPNSVDLEQFNSPPRGRQASPTVGLFYSPIGFKGIDTSLRAIRTAQERIPELKVVAFGTSYPTHEFTLPPNSTFHKNPDQDRLRDIYSACDAWLFGSRNEGFGLPLLEAMACRTPVVATSAGAAPELIRDGINGYVVDIDDSDALADRLVAVLSLGEEAWRSMSDAAFSVAAGYTWEDAADLFEEVLRT